MSEFTEEHLQALRPAMQAAGLTDNDFAKVRDQLTRPQHDFVEHQAVVNKRTHCLEFWDANDPEPDPCRHLTPSEVGPRYVERKLVNKLVRAAENVWNCAESTTTNMTDALEVMRYALDEWEPAEAIIFKNCIMYKYDE